MSQEIPDKFLGKFKLDRSENFDEFLAAKGVPWITRKLINFCSITKIFERSESDPNKYTSQNLSSKANTRYENWSLGETFEGKGLDGTKHKITYNLTEDKNTLTEEHHRLDQPEFPPETYYYTIENNELILKMQNDSLSCRRFFKKIN